jgi:lysine 2,3-aminomutase
MYSTMEIDEPPSNGILSVNNPSALQKEATILTTHTNYNSSLSKKPLKIHQEDKLNSKNVMRRVTKGNLRTHITISANTREFINKFYPEIIDEKWNDWHWQVASRIRTLEKLQQMIDLSESELEAIKSHNGPLPFAITPYYASLLNAKDASQPIRRTVVMTRDENFLAPGEAVDPLGEEEDSPVPGIVHRYPDRVLFLTTGFCSVYCRYCTRSRMVGVPGGEAQYNIQQWGKAIEYIKSHTEIRDVLLSGGDPLTLADERLEWLLSNLRAIPHVEFIRIGTKVPVVLPQRITPKLVQMMRKYHPVWMSIHFTHPDEITPEVSDAVQRLADAGIPLGSQTVLLKGINDSVEVMKKLFHELLKNRVKPYYMYQCDPVAGTSHFRTSVSKGIEIIAGLRGHTTGYAIPNYVIDAPGGGGKIPILPEYVQGRENGNLILKNFEGKLFSYPDFEENLQNNSEII